MPLTVPVCASPRTSDVDFRLAARARTIRPDQRGVPVLHFGPAELLLEQTFGVRSDVLNGPGVNLFQSLQGIAFLEIEIQIPARHINFVKR